MRWYVITLLLLAFLVGSLFQATEQTGMRIWNMFATMGIFLFGAVGSLAITRRQRQIGLAEIQQGLKALEPDWVITDWSHDPGARPDYLLVGPVGCAAVCVDQAGGALLAWWSRRRVAQGRRRTLAAAAWVTSQLAGLPMAQGLPVMPVLVLSGQRALPEHCLDGVQVLNPDQISTWLLAEGDHSRLDPAVRFQLTRHMREQAILPPA